jgi:two-component system LytT family response regulator
MNLTTTLKVIIVEDLALLRQRLERLVQQQPGFTVTGACGTVHEAVTIINNTKPDLLLLDIGLPDGTGFDILEKISVQTRVIFITAHNEFAIKAIRYGAIDYLLKPLNETELREALQRVSKAQPLLPEQIDITLNSFKKKQLQGRIALRSKGVVQFLELTDIIYLQADDSYTNIFLNTGKKEVITKTLKYHEELLPETSFLRTHQSYLVNKFYIDRYHPKEGKIYLKDATEIPVSGGKKEMVAQYFKTL